VFLGAASKEKRQMLAETAMPWLLNASI